MNFTKPEMNSKEVKNDLGTEMQDAGLDDKEAFYENSRLFFQFLQSQGLDDLLSKTGLRLRDKHHIVPHVSATSEFWRILAPLQGPPTALPEFPDDDTRYYYTKLTSPTWTDRYVEFESSIPSQTLGLDVK